MNILESNILFVGGLYPKEKVAEIISKSKKGLQMAANNFQWSLVEGFDQNLLYPITIMNQLFVGSYPKNYRDCFLCDEQFSHCMGANDINLGFVNCAYIKHFLPPIHETEFIKKWLKNNPRGSVFIYSLSDRTVRIAKKIKRYSHSTAVICSVNDLPQHIMKERDGSFLTRVWKRYLDKKIRGGLKYIDGFVLVAEHQRDILGVCPDKCVIVEAIATVSNKDFVPLKEQKAKRIVYAGTLAFQYNIMNLINAFKAIDDENIELVICGSGEAEGQIIANTLSDSRIKYLGTISKNEVDELLQSAWVLVNPRMSGQIFTDYSFPIKTIDYLLAGRPVICQKLEAIPQEYDEHLVYFSSSDNDVKLTETLVHILNKPINEINRIGKENFDFVVNNKNAVIQTQKVLDLFDQIREEQINFGEVAYEV